MRCSHWVAGSISKSSRVTRNNRQATPLMFAGLEGLKDPRFVSWAVAVDNIETVSQRAIAADCKVVGPTEGSRARTDGKLLRWKTFTVIDPAIDLLPFFIAWDRETPHPSQKLTSRLHAAVV